MALASVGKGDAAAHLRPTTDRVRESLFNVLSHRGVIDGARVLDVFAGTGALGLEALSRGAIHATFIDDGRVAKGLIRENIRKLNVSEDTRLIGADATNLPACDTAPFDLVFLDPPYDKGLGERAVQALIRGNWIAPAALIVWEDGHFFEPPEGLRVVDQRKYGESRVTLLSADTE